MEIYIKIPLSTKTLVEIETVARLVKNSIFIFLTSSTNSALSLVSPSREAAVVGGTAEKSHKDFYGKSFYLLPSCR